MAFVDFWKSNYYTVQSGLSMDPDQLAFMSGVFCSPRSSLYTEFPYKIQRGDSYADILPPGYILCSVTGNRTSP
ncbi:hypothetical protein BT96DRAFT_925704 [Gymnopus androsaceus JB14]|uniref:Uncharacterized protein n=1 Tax=Gymnopus androsaceus JB14 TaxID=1447944 RepID=A0A6A4GY93_9AGAR|nr:hypothetical protein BT96DRAFT_925704 [Gymnopus androsaceus JB14]